MSIMDIVEDVFRAALGLGLESKEIGALQRGLRAVVVYIVTVAMVRLAKKRFMGRTTAFDVILGIMLGSIVSRAVTGNAPFFPALAATAALLAMHWLFSMLAVRWHRFGTLIKGQPRLLVENGEVDRLSMKAAHMSDHDLWEDLRGKSVSDLKQVAAARLERSGQLSVLKAPALPKVIDVQVESGVQLVRVEIVSS